MKVEKIIKKYKFISYMEMSEKDINWNSCLNDLNNSLQKKMLEKYGMIHFPLQPYYYEKEENKIYKITKLKRGFLRVERRGD